MTAPFQLRPGSIWPGLSKVIEETSELNVVIGKLQAYPDGTYATGENLVAMLEEEVADVYAALDLLLDANALDVDFINARAEAKLRRFHHWLRGYDDVLPVPSREV